MRVLNFKILLLILSILLGLLSCAQTIKDTYPVRADSVFIKIRANEQNIDSIFRLFNIQTDITQIRPSEQGEFISSSFILELPLLPTGNVSDFIGLFSKEEKTFLDSIIRRFEELTTNQIAIVTIDSSWVNSEQFENFVSRLGNFWGVGQRDKNNGVIIGISPGHRRIRISNGYGVEKILSDVKTKQIIDQIIIPEFKSGNYFAGTKKGIEEIIKILNGG